jgi:putative peptidoglycan lipid II flippase
VLARTLPTILYDLLVGSVSTAAFVPVFVQHVRDERQFWRLLGAILSLAGLAFTVMAVILGLLAEPLIDLIGSGFRSDEQRALAANLMRIALVSVIFQGLAGVLTSALYAQNRFALPAFATAIYNAGIIAGILLLANVLDVYALAVGLVIGAVAQFLLQAVGLRAFWRAFRPRIDLNDPAVRRILTLGATVAAGLLVTIAGQLIDRWLASYLAEGSMQMMEFATRVIQVPLGIVGLAVSYAVLPTLASFSDGPRTNLAGYRDALVFGLKLVLVLMLFTLAVGAALAQPLIAVLFERGAFTAAETARTAAIFLAYSPMLPLTGIDYLLINAFYARQDARTPVIVGVVCVLIYLAVALTTIEAFGAVGLAFANAVQNSSHALILLLLLGRALPGLRLGAALWPFLVRVVPAAAVVGILLVNVWPSLSGLGNLIGGLIAAALGALVYAALLLLLGVVPLYSIRAWRSRERT